MKSAACLLAAFALTAAPAAEAQGRGRQSHTSSQSAPSRGPGSSNGNRGGHSGSNSSTRPGNSGSNNRPSKANIDASRRSDKTVSGAVHSTNTRREPSVNVNKGTAVRPNDGNNGNVNNRPGNGNGNNTRPGNSNGWTNNNNNNNRPGNGNHNGNNNNWGNDNRPGNGNHNGNNNNWGNDNRPGNDRPGGNHWGNNNRPGNDRPGGNHWGNNPGHGHGHGHGPGHRPGYRPPMPPRMPIGYRHPHPVFRGWARPLPPPTFHPVYGYGPSFNSILGITLGTALDLSLNTLLNSGYTIVNYSDDVVYLNGVNQMNLYWPSAALYYNGGRLYGSRFTYPQSYYDMTRYNLLYNNFCSQYGAPIEQVNNGGAITTTWYGYGNRFVTLEFNAINGNYYTTLSYGN